MDRNRRQMFFALTASIAVAASACRSKEPSVSDSFHDWHAVRDLFPLTKDWIHLASFLLVSHSKPVAEAIDHFPQKIDNDPLWIEAAAFSDSEGRFAAANAGEIVDRLSKAISPENASCWIDLGAFLDRRVSGV